MTNYNSDQEKFWVEEYADEYLAKNKDFDHLIGAKAWEKMLEKVMPEIDSYLECGCNRGRNIEQLNKVIPHADKSIIEISQPAFEIVTAKNNFANAYNGSILDSNFKQNNFRLVFTIGVLIHINPDQLLEHMKKMYDYSNKYILIGEYFNRTPVSIDYQGKKDKLFKRDFGKLFINEFNCELVDYGFLWGYIYDVAGFDDITWWLFRK